MTPTTAARKIAELRHRVARVRQLRPATATELASRETEAEALLLNLYLALQASSDLALHFVADRGLGIPGDARSAFQLLATAGLLDSELAKRLSAAVGMRNRIAHQYGTLDLALVHAASGERLGDLEALAAAVASASGLGD